MVILNIRRQNTCYNIVFVCVSTQCLFRIIYTSRRGNVRGMSESIRGNVRHSACGDAHIMMMTGV